jgi:hypothetical protein
VLRATAAVESQGVPAVPIITSGFVGLGTAMARNLGIGRLSFAVYPGVVMNDSDNDLADKVTAHVGPSAIASLTDRGNSPVDSGGEPEEPPEPEFRPRDVVFMGSLDAVQEYFTNNHWTDGLPIVPPTTERIDRFLEYSNRKADEVIANLPLENREATVWNVAVNGVMAGCRPEYLPVLLATVEAIADPRFRLQDAGSTPGWEPLVTVSGRISKELDFNVGPGALRVGRQANTSVGRFLRLYIRNMAGIRIPPVATDQGAIGMSFNVALAEDEDAVASLGWDPYRIDMGFDRHDNVVTVQSVVASSIPIYSSGHNALDHFREIAAVSHHAMAPWAWLGVEKHAWYPLLVLGPSIASTIAADGATKDDLRLYLYEEMRMTAGEMEQFARGPGYPGWRLEQLVMEGRADPAYAESDDPDRQVRILQEPEWTSIVVAGNSGRNQSRMYVNNHGQGRPTSKLVQLPR